MCRGAIKPLEGATINTYLIHDENGDLMRVTQKVRPSVRFMVAQSLSDIFSIQTQHIVRVDELDEYGAKALYLIEAALMVSISKIGGPYMNRDLARVKYLCGYIRENKTDLIQVWDRLSTIWHRVQDQLGRL